MATLTVTTVTIIKMGLAAAKVNNWPQLFHEQQINLEGGGDGPSGQEKCACLFLAKDAVYLALGHHPVLTR